MQKNRGAMGALILSMLIFGTIGILRRYIPLPSGALAFIRGAIGALFLLALGAVRGRKADISAIRRNAPVLCLSGACIGFNWILLFEAYNYTTVATATLCYYMAPVIVMLLSPIVLRERLTPRKIACIAAAIAGVVLVSGVTDAGFRLAELKGALLALGAAVLYACVILMNKKLSRIGAEDRTMVQLIAAAIVVAPYSLIAESISFAELDWLAVVLTLVAGVVHTGFAYAMYFGSIEKLKAQTVALLSYIDPVFAVILSALMLSEPLGAAGWTGALLVIGAMMLSELPVGKSSANN